jgi:retinol dehydrogenase-12
MLILGCRSLEKGNAAKNTISSQMTGSRTTIEIWQVDLASYQSVLAFGKRVQEQLPRLDAFISNAGVEPMVFELAEDLEMTLTVNVVSTMLLNVLVLPKLRATSVQYGIPTTLTTVGSSVHIFGSTGGLLAPSKEMSVDTFAILSDQNTADLGGPDAGMSPRYALSKTLLHAVLQHLAAKASRPKQKEQVIVNWVNPGWCASELGRHKNGQPMGARISFAFIGRTAEQGSRELVNAIFAGKDSHGHYLSECCVKPESTFLRSEEGIEFGERLWRELVARIEKISPETVSILA